MKEEMKSGKENAKTKMENFMNDLNAKNKQKKSLQIKFSAKVVIQNCNKNS